MADDGSSDDERSAKSPGDTPQQPSSGATEKGSPSTQSGGAETAGKNLIKLISVVSRAQGEEVESWWGLHPQFRRDLPPDEAKELAKHMNRATRIVGERFAVVASLAQSGTNPNQPVGNA